MADDVEGFLEQVETSERLRVALRVDSGDGYAPLGTDLYWLQRVHFCAGVAEVIAAQAMFPANIANALYPRPISEGFDDIFPRVLGQSWVDVYVRHGYQAERFFRVVLARRQGGPWTVGSGDILRVELVQLSKENPTVLQVIASGAAAAVLSLGVLFGGVQVIKERGAEACRQQVYDYGDRETERIMKIARLQGQWTAEHEAAMRDLQGSVKAGIAACGATLNEATITLKLGKPPEVGIHVGEAPKSRDGE